MDKNNEVFFDTLEAIIDNGCYQSIFTWDCKESIQELGTVRIFPDGVTDPFSYLLDMGYIHPDFQAVFSVFYSQLLYSTRDEGADKSKLLNVDIKFSKNGEFISCNMFVCYLKNDRNRVEKIIVFIRPLTDNERFEKNVVSRFSVDRGSELFTEAISEIGELGINRVAFIQFDIDRFKHINELYGSEVGDELLKFISDSLDIICGPLQPHCRFSADIFMIVTPYETVERLNEFIRRIESHLSNFKGMDYYFSFGVYLETEFASCKPSRRFGDCAAIARKRIKGNALRNVEFFHNDMEKVLFKRSEIEDDMYKAIANNEFVMYLQPKYCISTGKIVGAEALTRWIHPTKGMISPADFIPVFEQNGFIVKLDHYIWECAFRKIRDWIDSGIKPLPISVNVSRAYLREFDAVNAFRTLLIKYEIPVEMIELEITESIDSEGLDEIIGKFKECGFTMLMDDFGSGYSSLNMLKKTQFDVLKIDRSFLSEFMESDRGRKIISHTISMSQDIGLDIIAEGVETGEQASFLYGAGCDRAQGFYYSRPVPCDEFDKIMLENLYNYS